MRVARLLSGHYRLFGLLRNTARFAELRAAGITPLPGDLDNAPSLRRCPFARRRTAPGVDAMSPGQRTRTTPRRPRMGSTMILCLHV